MDFLCGIIFHGSLIESMQVTCSVPFSPLMLSSLAPSLPLFRALSSLLLCLEIALSSLVPSVAVLSILQVGHGQGQHEWPGEDCGADGDRLSGGIQGKDK